MEDKSSASRLKLIRDAILGHLLRINLGFEKPKDGKISTGFLVESLPIDDQLCFWDLSQLGLLDIRTTLSPLTFEKANSSQALLKLKADAVMAAPVSVDSAHGYGDLIQEANAIKKFVGYLKKKYKEDDQIDQNDLDKIQKKYPEISQTLLFKIFLSEKHIEKLKEYLLKYSDHYAIKDLEGQERLMLPEVYAKMILVKVNDKAFVSSFGTKRLTITNYGKTPIPLFCHSLLYLLRNGSVRIHEIKINCNLIDAVIDNLTVMEKTSYEVVSSVKPQDGYKKVLEVVQDMDGHIHIICNGKKYKLSRPELDSPSDVLIQKVLQLTENSKEIQYSKQNDPSSKEDLRGDLSTLVTRLGFKGLLRDLFFPRTTKNSVLFIRYYTREDLDKRSISLDDVITFLAPLQ